MKFTLRIYIFIAIIFILNTYSNYSQSLQITSCDTLITGTTGGYFSSASVCKNISLSDQYFRIKIHIITMPVGQAYSVCDLKDCWPFTKDDTVSVDPFKLKPDETTGNFMHLDLYPNDKAGTTKISLRFFIDKNEADYTEYTATFIVNPVGVEDDNNPTLQSLFIYPNPANDIINIGISKYLNHNSGTIEIYNSLGNPEKTLQVNSNTENMTINTYDLSAGTYLMILKSNGTKLLSQPFIIYR